MKVHTAPGYRPAEASRSGTGQGKPQRCNQATSTQQCIHASQRHVRTIRRQCCSSLPRARRHGGYTGGRSLGTKREKRAVARATPELPGEAPSRRKLLEASKGCSSAGEALEIVPAAPLVVGKRLNRRGIHGNAIGAVRFVNCSMARWACAKGRGSHKQTDSRKRSQAPRTYK